ncbi:MAG: 5'-methylthioadenosine/adenosylhomocysteine nucleosidase [Clostridiales bacterium]|nr:5'-methylthioadenosine/adenosylhomocysteine nucleosidase [Clostridiales bacterium]
MISNTGRSETMIGVIGAMQVEIQGLRAMLEDAETVTVSGIEFVTGRLEGHPVVMAVCGIGKVFAAICAQTMILRFPVRAIINTGCAGTLCRELGIGDVAVATDVVQHDMDTSGLGDPLGMLSGPNIIHIPAGRRLSALVEAAVAETGHRCVAGTIATGDQFLCQRERKQWIHDTFGGIAGEMEGGSIGQVCYVNNIPFAVIRTISDDADGNAPADFPAFAAQAAQTSIQITASVLRRIQNEERLD